MLVEHFFFNDTHIKHMGNEIPDTHHLKRMASVCWCESVFAPLKRAGQKRTGRAECCGEGAQIKFRHQFASER